MKNKEFSAILEKRTLDFAISIIRLSASLPKSYEAGLIRNQITKSGTSIGANYREANRARSQADFRNKIKISESEASETLYWLEIIKETNFIPEQKLMEMYAECNELVALFSSIAKNSNSSTCNSTLVTRHS